MANASCFSSGLSLQRLRRDTHSSTAFPLSLHGHDLENMERVSLPLFLAKQILVPKKKPKICEFFFKLQAEAAILNLGKTLPTPLKQAPRLSGDFLSLSRHFSPHTRRLIGRGFKVFRLANSSDRVKKEGKGILTPPP